MEYDFPSGTSNVSLTLHGHSLVVTFALQDVSRTQHDSLLLLNRKLEKNAMRDYPGNKTSPL